MPAPPVAIRSMVTVMVIGLTSGMLLAMSSDSSVIISPSVLTADFSRLGQECRDLDAAGADRIHWDVMDGQFVPNMSMGADIIRSCRDQTDLHFEAHLMVQEPDRLLPGFAKAGCQTILVHAEACTHLHRTLGIIRELGASAGVVLNPHTPIDSLRHVLDLIDMVLLMTVNPGFGGQSYISAMEPKITATRSLLDTADHHIDLEVDGGISSKTIAAATSAGANVFVAGSAVIGHPGGYAAAIDELHVLGAAALG